MPLFRSDLRPISEIIPEALDKMLESERAKRRFRQRSHDLKTANEYGLKRRVVARAQKLANCLGGTSNNQQERPG